MNQKDLVANNLHDNLVKNHIKPVNHQKGFKFGFDKSGKLNDPNNKQINKQKENPNFMSYDSKKLDPIIEDCISNNSSQIRNLANQNEDTPHKY